MVDVSMTEYDGFEVAGNEGEGEAVSFMPLRATLNEATVQEKAPHGALDVMTGSGDFSSGSEESEVHDDVPLHDLDDLSCSLPP